jgi:hypothetical protein
MWGSAFRSIVGECALVVRLIDDTNLITVMMGSIPIL